MHILAFVEGRIVSWTPLPGLDPTLGERVLQLGAMAYGRAKHLGKPEEVAQQEAERVMYRMTYQIKY